MNKNAWLDIFCKKLGKNAVDMRKHEGFFSTKTCQKNTEPIVSVPKQHHV